MPIREFERELLRREDAVWMWVVPKYTLGPSLKKKSSEKRNNHSREFIFLYFVTMNNVAICLMYPYHALSSTLHGSFIL